VLTFNKKKTNKITISIFTIKQDKYIVYIDTELAKVT